LQFKGGHGPSGPMVNTPMIAFLNGKYAKNSPSATATPTITVCNAKLPDQYRTRRKAELMQENLAPSNTVQHIPEMYVQSHPRSLMSMAIENLYTLSCE